MALVAKTANPSKQKEVDSGTKPKQAKKGKNVRISDDLYELADEYASIGQRSVQKQIEYWSQLGHLVEMSLNSSDLYALLSQKKFITNIMLANNDVPSADMIMAELNQDRVSGSLKSRVTQANVVYDLADDGSTLRRIDADGTVTLGSLVNGEFLETKNK